MTLDAWAYASGLCEAREAAFLAQSFITELAGLRPEDAATRLSRTPFGAIAELEDFDEQSRARRNREFDDIAKACPNDVPVKLAVLSESAGEIHTAVNQIARDATFGDVINSLERASIRARWLADEFAGELQRAGEGSGRRSKAKDARLGNAQTAASLIVDSAELLAGLNLAEESADETLVKWAEAYARLGCAKTARRAVRLGLEREDLETFFFRGHLLTPETAEFIRDFNEQSAMTIAGGMNEETLYAITAAAKGEPFSPARVLNYLQGFLRQEKRLRVAAYTSLGNLAGKDAA